MSWEMTEPNESFTFDFIVHFRYIEIFKSSLGEASRVMQMNSGMMGMPKPKPLMQGLARPGPYDRSERFMGGGMSGGMGMGGFGYGKGRGGRNLKGTNHMDQENYCLFSFAVTEPV